MGELAAYIDIDDDRRNYPTIIAFTKKTGIKVDYKESINDNDEFLGNDPA